jgi:two-component system phosphate regulon response regulator OmpR
MSDKKEYHILVIDDDDRIRNLLSKYLRDNYFLVSTAANAKEAYDILEELIPDIIIVDVMMPNETGIELTTNIRQKSNVPIIMLTALSETEDRINGLEVGADDYLAKPFEPKELLLRINNMLKRTNIKNTFITIGPFSFDLDNNRLSGPRGYISLTTSEAKLLSILAANQGQIITREKLAELCGGINERSIDVQIIRLRNKIEQDTKRPIYLQTVRGEGYILHR